ncbi:hypothetical protein BLNAU_17543 [Blattamonas nauphoetae]|uniref:Metallo-beta-lactamase domain-containing protein n=1 Tax=Blattamonas nauphoetae TaxID=2049346 RepID=A0ABQ9X7A9_9EUKA|nr:hypothetical protein BLNAU_17543 [Blattamonas nauphoetae]
MSGNDPTSSKESPTSLEEPENVTTLLSFVTKKSEAEEVIEWKDLMEWFVSAVLGLESKASSHDSLEPFEWGHVMIDEFGTARITSPSFFFQYSIDFPQHPVSTNASNNIFQKIWFHMSFPASSIIHSLPASPLSHAPPKQNLDKYTERFLAIFEPDSLDLTERFHTSLFDEIDNETLIRSLLRCRSILERVRIDMCIVDIPQFLDRTVSLLSNSNALVRMAAFLLLRNLLESPLVLPLLPRLFNRLRSAFRDGWELEQYTLIWISIKWINIVVFGAPLPPFLWGQFDWEGLTLTEMKWSTHLSVAIGLMLLLRRASNTNQIDSAEATRIILSFEQHQNALSQVRSDDKDFLKIQHGDRVDLVQYSLLITLLTRRDFPVFLTEFLVQHPEIDVTFLLPFPSYFFLLSHTSLNRHRPHQPPLDLIFERVLRQLPLSFFAHAGGIEIEPPPSLLNTALCGFHALCRRGVHFSFLENEFVRKGVLLFSSIRMFFTHLISNTFHLFLYFPPPLVVRFFLPVLWAEHGVEFVVEPLKKVMLTLLIVTAPFGDCRSLKELFQSSRHKNDIDNESIDVLNAFRGQSLEWLNIPTGFSSALAYSNKRVPVHRFGDPGGLHHPPEESLEFTRMSSSMFRFLSNHVNGTRGGICFAGDLIRMLRPFNASFLFTRMKLLILSVPLLSPVPAIVSSMLEFVKRLACLCNVGNRMEMVATHKEGDIFKVGPHEGRVIHTPGHSPGVFPCPSRHSYLAHVDCVVYLQAERCRSVLPYSFIILFTGRTDLPGGSWETLVDSIKTKLFVLPDDTRVICGHGSDTTIGYEKRRSPIL